MTKSANPGSDITQVFLSYAREDQAFCKKLAADLEQASIDVWMDQHDIKLGKRWDTEIQQAIKQAETMLVVSSPAAFKSENVLDEINLALEVGVPVVPVMIKPCEVPFRISRNQRSDFTGVYKVSLERLAARLKEREPVITAWERLLDGAKQRLARHTLALSVSISLIALLVAVTLQLKPDQPPPALVLRAVPALVDADSNNIESTTIDPGPTLSDGTGIKTYHWKLDGQALAETRVVHLELTSGGHTVLLSVIDDNGALHEASLDINVLTRSQGDELATLLDIARQNIQISENNFQPALLAEGVSSAYVALLEALKLDSGNAEARQLLQQIADRYAAEARSKIKQQDNVAAAALIERGLQVAPDHTGLVDLRQALGS